MIKYTRDELRIFAEFAGRCAKCGAKAVTLHEIVPKSKRPKTWNTPENKIALCVDCHIWAHQYGTRRVRDELRSLRFNSRYKLEKGCCTA